MTICLITHQHLIFYFLSIKHSSIISISNHCFQYIKFKICKSIKVDITSINGFMAIILPYMWSFNLRNSLGTSNLILNLVR